MREKKKRIVKELSGTIPDHIPFRKADILVAEGLWIHITRESRKDNTRYLLQRESHYLSQGREQTIFLINIPHNK